MLTTEAQAKDRWCRFSTVMIIAKNGSPTDFAPVVVNRPSTDARTGCLGSQCMAWRWYDPEVGMAERRKGYCGADGEPKIKE